MKKAEKIILFDGVCNLCNGFVHFVIKREKSDVFKFAALQSDQAIELLAQYDLISTDMKSVILIDTGRNKAFTESSAVLHIFGNLKGLFPLLQLFFIIPKFIRDFVYQQIAVNRYRWFGKRNSCMLPTPELKKKFL
ncbi:MAG TPA: thiol-disulfide oxidoreductase DCC family protein [Flavobacteriaceae bacterium]|nr:thiol-disulfide oxidoreductase DCC family protein [Flavobacteriaceae bacterium]